MNRSEIHLAIALLAGLTSIHAAGPLAAQLDYPLATQGDAPSELSPDEMIPQLREMLAQDPDNATGHLNLGALLLQKGETEEAKQHLLKAVELAPESVEAHANLGAILEQEGELADAEKHYTEALQLFPENTQIRVRRAAIRNRLGRSEEALADLDQVIALEPSNIQALFGKGMLLASVGRQSEAIQVLRLVPERATEPGPVAESHFQIGQILMAAGQLADATTEMRQAVAANPELMAAHLGLGNALAEQRKFSEAADEFSVVVAAEPENQTAHFGLSIALLMSERYEEARASLESSIGRFPNSLSFKHALARLLATCPEDDIRDGERALQLAQEVLQTRPDLEHAQTYAMALAETQSFDQAAEVQRQILEQAASAAPGQNLSLLQERLETYEQGQPVRAPWLGQG